LQRAAVLIEAARTARTPATPGGGPEVGRWKLRGGTQADGQLLGLTVGSSGANTKR